MRAIARPPSGLVFGVLKHRIGAGISPYAIILRLSVRKGEIMISIDMTRIGKIDAVGTVQVFGYSSERSLELWGHQ